MRRERRQDLLARQQRTRDELIALCRQRSPTWPEDELGPWADAKLQVHPSAVELYGREPGDWRATARGIQCPALLVTADPERGAIITPEQAEEAGRLLPRGQTVRIAGAGHSIQRENSVAFLGAVRAFLAER